MANKKQSKKVQFSKIITLVLLVMNFLTWLVILIRTWGEIEYLHLLPDFLTTTTTSILPYCTIAVADRIQYALQSKGK